MSDYRGMNLTTVKQTGIATGIRKEGRKYQRLSNMHLYPYKNILGSGAPGAKSKLAMCLTSHIGVLHWSFPGHLNK